MRLPVLPILVLLGTTAARAQGEAPPPVSAAKSDGIDAVAKTVPSSSLAPSEIDRSTPGPTNTAVLLQPITLSPGPGRMAGPGEAGWIDFEHRRYGGTFGDALASPKPWQFFNPFAPASYGDGTRYLRQDPYTGRAEGVVLFSIRLPGGNSGKSLAKSRTKQGQQTQSKPTAGSSPTAAKQGASPP
ncbi:MAG: hypothetical protein H7A46_01645 [Verrucomicrobiales bacterium]|nr:hypothetical protein [Verrucomicrobiales bacterium]